jgi:hypothetical protein
VSGGHLRPGTFEKRPGAGLRVSARR